LGIPSVEGYRVLGAGAGIAGEGTFSLDNGAEALSGGIGAVDTGIDPVLTIPDLPTDHAIIFGAITIR
jgi:hypothetical protein